MPNTQHRTGFHYNLFRCKVNAIGVILQVVGGKVDPEVGSAIQFYNANNFLQENQTFAGLKRVLPYKNIE